MCLCLTLGVLHVSTTKDIPDSIINVILSMSSESVSVCVRVCVVGAVKMFFIYLSKEIHFCTFVLVLCIVSMYIQITIQNKFDSGMSFNKFTVEYLQLVHTLLF